MAPPKPNGFSCFMFEYIAKERKKGNNMSPAQGQSVCGPLWQAMSDQEKAAYKAKSKNLKMGPVRKLASDGSDIEQFERREAEKAAMDKRLVAEIAKRITDTPIDGLADLKFYFIGVSLFCKTLKNEHIPAEISVVEFSVREGTTASLHLIIDPGQIPKGYLSDAMSAVKDIHCIPIKPHEEKVASYVTVVNMENAFYQLREWSAARNHPIFCAMQKHIPIVRGALDTLVSREGVEYQFKISSASALLFHLKHASAEESDSSIRFPFLDTAREALERDTYYFIESIACAFHRSNEERMSKLSNCTLSQVQRLVYYICDHCCRPLQIRMRPDVHAPAEYVPASFEPEQQPKVYDDDDGGDGSWSVVPPRQSTPPANPRGRGRGRRM